MVEIVAICDMLVRASTAMDTSDDRAQDDVDILRNSTSLPHSLQRALQASGIAGRMTADVAMAM